MSDRSPAEVLATVDLAPQPVTQTVTLAGHQRAWQLLPRQYDQIASVVILC